MTIKRFLKTNNPILYVLFTLFDTIINIGLLLAIIKILFIL